jgi:hypothetical protein
LSLSLSRSLVQTMCKKSTQLMLIEKQNYMCVCNDEKKIELKDFKNVCV